MSKSSAPLKRFRVALSFPGEKRDYVEQIANLLAARFTEERILYDRFHTAEFATPNLPFILPKLYREESDLVVAVICSDSEKKEWFGLEWRAIFALIKGDRANDIMLFRTDMSELPGLHGFEGFVQTDACPPEEACKLILQRLARNENKPRDFYLPLPIEQSLISSGKELGLPIAVDTSSDVYRRETFDRIEADLAAAKKAADDANERATRIEAAQRGRMITNGQAERFLQSVAALPKGCARFSATAGDMESFSFAEVLRELLAAGGYSPVTAVGSRTSLPPVVGVAIEAKDSMNPPLFAVGLRDALDAIGLQISRRLWTDSYLRENEVRVVVGAKPVSK